MDQSGFRQFWFHVLALQYHCKWNPHKPPRECTDTRLVNNMTADVCHIETTPLCSYRNHRWKKYYFTKKIWILKKKRARSISYEMREIFSYIFLLGRWSSVTPFLLFLETIHSVNSFYPSLSLSQLTPQKKWMTPKACQYNSEHN